MNKAICLIFFLLCVRPSLWAEKVYEASLEKDSPTTYALTISFKELPSAELINKTLKSQLENVLLIDNSKDISAFAFKGDTMISESQYCGGYFYSAADKTIKTFQESRGLKSEFKKEVRYSVEIKEDKTFAGIVPERKWLDVTLTYPIAPNPEEAFQDLKMEMEKLKEKGMDISGSAMVGSPSTSLKTLRDGAGKFVMLKYEVSTGQIKRQ
jgi:hypothetical protein